MIITKALLDIIRESVQNLYAYQIPDAYLSLSETKKEFEGDLTFVVFPLVKQLKKNPALIADEIGNQVVKRSSLVKDFNVIKGFVNFSLTKEAWSQIFMAVSANTYFNPEKRDETILVEYSSPNTNKPLHLGHIRNILLGWSVAQIAEANGYKVIKTQIVNDRGIAICKSMVAWLQTAEGATPNSVNIKGDHFVGEYYVRFEKLFQKEYQDWQSTEQADATYRDKAQKEEERSDFFKRYKNEYFNNFSTLGKQTKDMLLKWEEGDMEVRKLWEKMNSWVYEGFDITYKNLGVHFDKNYYESDTYLLGKSIVLDKLKQGLFYSKDDGSVWANLEEAGMDHKLLLRSDGTSVYITQDIGTARIRYDNHSADKMIYVVADEQDYHFRALFEVIKLLEEPFANGLYHLNYGMVDLPSGKMKSREGTVVDADDLIKEVIAEAKSSASERGGLEGLSEADRNEVYRKVGMAALKYFIIKVNPRKRMTFDPKDSVDMQGTTGPYIQNAYVRIQSILRKASEESSAEFMIPDQYSLAEVEKEILHTISQYPEVIQESHNKLDPSLVANYAYSLAKSYHRFYHDCSILKADSEAIKKMRLGISVIVGNTLKQTMKLLGIEMPEYM